MSEMTPIQWADGTCNPTMGCDGCELRNAKRKSCYAGAEHDRVGAYRQGYSPRFELVTFWPGRMAKAATLADLRGRRRHEKPWLDGLPRLIFVSDMSDALSKAVSFDYLKAEIVDNVISAAGRRHCWQWLTKRPKRMADFAAWLLEQGIAWPENLWAGTTITSAITTRRIDHLLNVGNEDTIRFLSVEPQIEPIDLRPWLPRLDWIIQGGESGSDPRKFDIEWAQEMHQHCQEASVPYFLKQLGAAVSCGEEQLPVRAGHGGDWDEWPEGVPRVRQMPNC